MNGERQPARLILAVLTAHRRDPPAFLAGVPPVARAVVRKSERLAPEQLDGETFNAAWKAGRTLSLEQAVARALSLDAEGFVGATSQP